MLTPTKVVMKLILSIFVFMEILNIRGNQCTMAAMMANTAPIDST
jgi:hypothetical protein